MRALCSKCNAYAAGALGLISEQWHGGPWSAHAQRTCALAHLLGVEQQVAVAAEGQRPILLLLGPDGGVVVQAEGKVVLQGTGQSASGWEHKGLSALWQMGSIALER